MTKKAKSDFFANSFDLHFIAATIEKQQDLETIDK
jgi:hypothetical protein